MPDITLAKAIPSTAEPKFFFSREPRPVPRQPVQLPAAVQIQASSPADYLAEPGLVDAVNTALLINQPLLLTGEAGTGKTQLAAAIAYQLGYRSPLRFQAKSTSLARDLFYSYDAVGHFRAAQGTAQLEFVRFEALGLAVLFANQWEKVSRLLPGLPPHEAMTSVVLIDEIDKAPRDFPNDILAEIEQLEFRAPEIGVDLAPLQANRPVVVVTSNSERDLPDAFLRRCVYYDIPFPAPQTLREILERRLRPVSDKREDAAFIDAALEQFGRIRSLRELRKKPATAELIAWVSALRRAYPEASNPLSVPGAAVARLGVLLKTRDDLQLATRAIGAGG